MSIKKQLISMVIGIFMMLSLTSCAVPAEAQVIVDYPSVEVVIAEGIPYMIDNVITYYLYGGRYWYPYYHNGHRYLRPYDRPFARHRHAIPYYRNRTPNHIYRSPRPRTHYDRREMRHLDRAPGHMSPSTRPNIRSRVEPRMGSLRPSTSPRMGSSRPSRGHSGHFGGRR